MAQKNYKVNEAIKVDYQTPGSQTGLTVQMDVYDETDTLDAGKSTTMTEQGARGKHVASFTPDAQGDWRVEIDDGAGGEAIKHYSVGAENIHSVGGKIDALNDISTTEVNTEVDTALADYDGPTKAELDTAESNVRGTDNDTLKDISDQIDNIVAPPMIG